jgi:hypothetical protein
VSVHCYTQKAKGWEQGKQVDRWNTMVWMSVSPPYFICWNPKPHDDDIRKWGLYEVVMSWIETPCPFYHMRTSEVEKVPSKNQEADSDNNSALFILNIPASRAVRNKFPLLISYPVCGILL